MKCTARIRSAEQYISFAHRTCRVTYLAFVFPTALQARQSMSYKHLQFFSLVYITIIIIHTVYASRSFSVCLSLLHLRAMAFIASPLDVRTTTPALFFTKSESVMFICRSLFSEPNSEKIPTKRVSRTLQEGCQSGKLETWLRFDGTMRRVVRVLSVIVFVMLPLMMMLLL